LRYPKGKGCGLEFQDFQHGKAVIRRTGKAGSPVIWACGAEVKTAMEVAGILQNSQMDCTVIDARFLKPFDRELAEKFAGYQHFTIEDHCVCGGLYSALAETLAGMPHGKITAFAWDSEKVIPHGETGVIKKQEQLDAGSIAGKIIKLVEKI
jgi:1-deoxy-D-xylulose-5-phosphate synthase